MNVKGKASMDNPCINSCMIARSLSSFLPLRMTLLWALRLLYIYLYIVCLVILVRYSDILKMSSLVKYSDILEMSLRGSLRQAGLTTQHAHNAAMTGESRHTSKMNQGTSMSCSAHQVIQYSTVQYRAGIQEEEEEEERLSHSSNVPHRGSSS